MRRLALLVLLCACTESLATLTLSDEPVLPPPPSPSERDTIATTQGAGCAIVEGAMWCWGRGVRGELGVVMDDSPRPVLVDDSRTWVEVRGGSGHFCALEASGELWCWGDNGYGQLGVGDREAHAGLVQVNVDGTPFSATTVDCRFEFCCAIRPDESLWCWGRNDEAQLGQMNVSEARPVPMPVEGPARWRLISVGDGHGLALTTDGQSYGWGRAVQGQLGDGGTLDDQVRGAEPIAQLDWSELAGGAFHSCGIAEGEVYCWGQNIGQLGLASDEDFDVPQPVMRSADRVHTDTFHTCALQEGQLYCWGRGIEGQLGLGDIEPRQLPTQVGRRNDWTEVVTARFFTCARRSDASVWCSGLNDEGQLGNGAFNRTRALTEVGFD